MIEVSAGGILGGVYILTACHHGVGASKVGLAGRLYAF